MSRDMKCTYGDGKQKSNPYAAFFENHAKGSAWANRTCGVCGYAPEAHEPEVAAKPHLAGKTQHQFVEHPGEQMDRYYCGCYGWD